MIVRVLLGQKELVDLVVVEQIGFGGFGNIEFFDHLRAEFAQTLVHFESTQSLEFHGKRTGDHPRLYTLERALVIHGLEFIRGRIRTRLLLFDTRWVSCVDEFLKPYVMRVFE